VTFDVLVDIFMDPDPKDYITTMITLRGEVRKFSNRGGGILPSMEGDHASDNLYLPSCS